MKILRVTGAFMAIFILLSYTGLARAATYITDSIEFPLRVEPSPKGKVLENLTSGQSVELVEVQSDWSRVRVLKPDGTTGRTGWVFSRSMMNRLPWELQAKNLQMENTSLKEKLSGFQERERNDQQVAEAFKKLQDEYDALRSGSANYLQLKEDYDSVQSKLSEAQTTVQQLKQENNKLRISQQLQWFLAGGSVMLIGWLFGLIMGRSQKKRHSYRLG